MGAAVTANLFAFSSCPTNHIGNPTFLQSSASHSKQGLSKQTGLLQSVNAMRGYPTLNIFS
jgi:hypothetical protein